jgi:tetratricopeptide (TPR) repeat protein
MRIRLLLSVVLAAVLPALPIVTAQTPAKSSAKMVAANELYKQNKFPESAAAFSEVVKEEPSNGRAWFFLGMSFHSQGKYERAIAAFEKNLTIAQNPMSMYNIACGYSRLKQVDKAFEWLDKAVKTGPGAIANPENDADLDNIRGDARFAKFLQDLDRAKKPCMYAAESRQLDFWIGKWEVLTPQGQKAGVNIIEPFADGCALMENWTATGSGSGKSINYYDPSTQKWYQFWIGSGGGALRYAGSFKDGAMRFEAETTGNAKKVLHRLTFSKIDENTVRQFAELSNDEGKTWTVSYDFKYVKMK